jgi:hypothetical protein
MKKFDLFYINLIFDNKRILNQGNCECKAGKKIKVIAKCS